MFNKNNYTALNYKLPPISEDTSYSIKVIRVLCIFCMIYVHNNPNLENFVDLQQTNPSLWFIKTVIADVFGRASVPALSVISGYLAVHVIRRYTYTIYCKSRIKSLIFPMIAWNIIGVLFALALFYLLNISSFRLVRLQESTISNILLEQILVIGKNGFYPQMYFLRDIFVCSLLLPILIALSHYLKWGAPILILLIGELYGFSPIIYRDSILIFFVLGIVIALNVDNFQWVEKFKWLIIGAIPIIIIIELYAAYFIFYQLIKLAVVSLFIIWLSLQISKTSSVFKHLLHKIEPHIYLVFLSHMFFFGILWGIWSRIFGKQIDELYIIFYLLAPPITILLIYTANKVIKHLPSIIRIALTGK